MDKVKIQNERQIRRHGRVRAKISGTEARPRLSVFRSNNGMFLQLVDDLSGTTLVSAKLTEIKKTPGKMGRAIPIRPIVKKMMVTPIKIMYFQSILACSLILVVYQKSSNLGTKRGAINAPIFINRIWLIL